MSDLPTDMAPVGSEGELSADPDEAAGGAVPSLPTGSLPTEQSSPAAEQPSTAGIAVDPAIEGEAAGGAVATAVLTDVQRAAEPPERLPQLADETSATGPGGRRWRLPTPQGLATFVTVAGVVAVTLSQLHLGNILSNNTPTGGDNGAHIAMASFLRHNLLTHGRVTGWDPGWYDGFPLYTYYFPLPGLMIALTSFFVHYGVAFKLVTVSGPLSLPVAAWAFGKLAGLRAPAPACLAAATLPFLFEPSFTIWGGNLFSMLAGEYSYGIALSFALLFLGVVAYGLRTGRHRAWAAVLFAAVILSHVVVIVFAVLGAAVLVAASLARTIALRLRTGRRGRAGWKLAMTQIKRQVWWAAGMAFVGAALASWWAWPFMTEQAYATNMHWGNETTYVTALFPEEAWWALAIAGAYASYSIVRAKRMPACLAVIAVAFAGIYRFDPQGKLWNTRFVPIWFLCVYLLVGLCFADVFAVIARWYRHHVMRSWVRTLRSGRLTRRPRLSAGAPGGVWGALAALVLTCLVVVPPLIPKIIPVRVLTDVGVTPGPNAVTNWSSWNYTGYQGKPAYPEYKAVYEMMSSVGSQYGCGQSMWEYNPNQDRFGSPMALMLMPYWTDGCIGSMEGLLFESSATTPYHFLNQAELSVSPSEPMQGLDYTGLNIPLGIEHLQLLGVRYFLAASPEVETAALADPNLTLIDSTGPWDESYNNQPLDTTWDVFLVHDSETVEPLAYQPVVLSGVGQSQDSWLPVSTSWYADPSRWGVMLSSDGPAGWRRVTPDQATTAADSAVPEPTTTVSDVQDNGGTVRFHVNRTGTPVLVKVSYFPNWQAFGAEGPWRVAPNLMLVVPTSENVTLHYGTSQANFVGLALTGLGLILLVVLVRRPVLSIGRAARSRSTEPVSRLVRAGRSLRSGNARRASLTEEAAPSHGGGDAVGSRFFTDP